MNRKKSGDEAEQFVSEYLSKKTCVTEIHPRTYRPLIGKDGKSIYHNGRPLFISKDNDYHNSFDIKAECPKYLLYVQSKFQGVETGAIQNNNIVGAMRNIDKNFPYNFPYIRIQIWLLWKEWVKHEGERRHKEYKFRIWERTGFKAVMINGIHKFKGEWIEMSREDFDKEMQVIE